MTDQSDRIERDDPEAPATRFLRSAKLCRTRDLKQLFILSELVKYVSELIHALQKERGAASIFLGSNGTQFVERLAQRSAECSTLELAVRERLEHLDERLSQMSSAARFYTRVAFAFHALDTLPGTREQITSLIMAPQDAVKAFTEVIGSLLAVVFETADIAADPIISRALVAFVNFAQGKEFAGQERATAGAAFSRGLFHETEHLRLQRLVAAQEQAFRIFSEFADPTHAAVFRKVLTGRDSAQVERMRNIAFVRGRLGELGVTGEAWFEQTSRRIDAMKTIEDQLAADLQRLCAAKLAEVHADTESTAPGSHDTAAAAAPMAMLVMDADPALNGIGLGGGIGLYTLDGIQPKTMHSILDVVQAQSRRIHDVNHQLESTRMALNERKVIERAKGLLMASRRISEDAAYALMRQTAMNQNKRIFEIAEAVVGMAEILKV